MPVRVEGVLRRRPDAVRHAGRPPRRRLAPPPVEADTLEFAPTLRPEGLRGGLLYHDGVEDDARYTLAVVRTALADGRAWRSPGSERPGSAGRRRRRARGRPGARPGDRRGPRHPDTRRRRRDRRLGGRRRIIPFGGGSMRILPSRGAHLVVPRGGSRPAGLTIRVPGQGRLPRPVAGPLADRHDRRAVRRAPADPAADGWEVDELLATVNAHDGRRPPPRRRRRHVRRAAAARRAVRRIDRQGVARAPGQRRGRRRRPDRRRQVHDLPGDGPRRRRCGPRAGRGAGTPEPDGRAPARRRGRPGRARRAGSPRARGDPGLAAHAVRTLPRGSSPGTGRRRPGVARASGADLDLLRPLVPGRPFLEAEVAWAARHELAAVARRRAGPADCGSPGAARSRRGRSRRAWRRSSARSSAGTRRGRPARWRRYLETARRRVRGRRVGPSRRPTSSVHATSSACHARHRAPACRPSATSPTTSPARSTMAASPSPSRRSSLVVVVALVALARLGWFAAAARHPGARTGIVLAVALVVVGCRRRGTSARRSSSGRRSSRPAPADGVDPRSPPPVRSRRPWPAPSAEPIATAVPTRRQRHRRSRPRPSRPASSAARTTSTSAAGPRRSSRSSPGASTCASRTSRVRNGPDLFVYLSPDARRTRTRMPSSSAGSRRPTARSATTCRRRDRPGRLPSAIIWCKQFSHLFATAPFESPDTSRDGESSGYDNARPTAYHPARKRHGSVRGQNVARRNSDSSHG